MLKHVLRGRTGQLSATLFWAVLCMTALSNAQTVASADSSPAPRPLPALLRSAFVPGSGQIYQERLLPGALFYGSALTFYYRAFYHLYRYRYKGKAQHHWASFKWNMSMAAFIHAINILDVADAGFREHPPGWQGALLADRPIKSPWGATLRSAILPGWGQWYNESYWKALAYFVVDGYLIYRIRAADLAYQNSRKTSDRDDRSRFAWYFGLAYLITLADAHAGAYLYRFDEAIKLTVVPGVEGDSFGISCQIAF